jgi:4-diphosphocytidyl-2-C-methyl-D-erythritol kinase
MWKGFDKTQYIVHLDELTMRRQKTEVSISANSQLATQHGFEHILLSPAKVNLFLKVLSKRVDGYHNIISIVDIISLYDVIHIKEQRDGKVIVKDDKGILPDGERNTIYKAVMLLKETYKVDSGVRVYVEKNIPVGSGLGGPSSNAATVLKGMKEIWELSIGDGELMALGSKIGADVPLFLYGKSCIMKGIGERILPVELPALWYLIVYPDVILQTREVYEGLKIVLTKGENDIKLRGKFETTRDIAGILENDLEKIGILICPKIDTIKDRLRRTGSIGALMSGSGSSVFGIFESERAARKASNMVSDMGSIFIAHSI